MGNLFIDEINSAIECLSEYGDCECMNELNADQLSNMYRGEAAKALDDLFVSSPPSREIMNEMHRVGALFIGLLLKKNVYSEFSTGIAITGFGNDDQFPSLYVYDTEGVIAGKVKRTLTEKVIISPNGQRGHISPLAQDDVVKRYVEGIDPGLAKQIERGLSEMMTAFGEGLATNYFRGAKRQSVIEHATGAASQATNGFMEHLINKAKERERKEITDVVHHMSKSELAQLAEALVEMTALRRRVSLDVETVGGPIDVAVISRGDVFVWVKRKHYFDPALNSRYFAAKIKPLVH